MTSFYFEDADDIIAILSLLFTTRQINILKKMHYRIISCLCTF